MGTPGLAWWVAIIVVLAEVSWVVNCQSNGEKPQNSPTSGSKDQHGSAIDADVSQPQDTEPGAVHWALAAILGAVLVSGLVQVYRVLHGLDVMSTAMRNVPEGMRPAECGACHTMQYVSTHGRIFICFCCHSANRIPRDTSRSDHQLLVVPTGPLRSYEFQKGGENFWQELSRQELPAAPEENSAEVNGETRKLHYRGVFCIACGELTCTRLNEFPELANAAYLAETHQAEAATAVRPQMMGRQADVSDEIQSERSSRNADGLPQCVVCLDKSGCMVLLPCAHGGVCEECATRIAQNRASGGAHCPHCRASIETLVRLHQVAGDLARGVEVRIPMARPA